ncbi:MAG: amidase [Planctomycetota bacterium]
MTPKELVACAIERIEARNPVLNAVVNRMFASAREVAQGPLPDGPFSGVPFLLKDLLAAFGGQPLTASCRFLAGFTPEGDSELVCRHKRAGLIVVGQTNTPEFGIMPVTESRFRGPAHNPWNIDHTPGGSSGGSAAAVAAGFVPIAHGNDGGGSIRIPASCCGLFGLKPTRGRNPLGPEIGDGWGGFVQDHVLTRSVRDSAAMLDATQGPDLGAPYCAPPVTGSFGDEGGRDPARLRIAFTARSLFGRSTHPDCAAAVEEAAKLCESLGHSVEEAPPAFDRAYLVHCFLVLLAAETARVIRWAGKQMNRTPRPDGFEPQTWILGLIGRSATAEDHAEALEAAYMAGRRIAGFFQTFDVLMTPTMAHPPARIGHFDLTTRQALELSVIRRLPLKRLLDKVLDVLSGEVFEATGNTMLFNMTGQPAASVPLCWNAAGLPIGVQFVARFGDEATLFRLAGQLEQARPWFDRRPPRLDT